MNTVKPLTKKESAELRKIDRLQMAGRATRAQLLRGFELHRKDNAAYRAAHGIRA
jgi:hypothetical protein